MKRPEIVRDDMGRFDRHGKTLSRTAKKTGLNKQVENEKRIGEGRPGPGRPKGSKNRTTLQLRELVLKALDMVGGEQYLARLAVENSSAYASLLGKVLGNAHASDLDGRETVKVTFTRVIVHPGQQAQSSPALPQIEQKASHTLPSDDVIDVEPNDIN